MALDSVSIVDQNVSRQCGPKRIIEDWESLKGAGVRIEIE